MVINLIHRIYANHSNRCRLSFHLTVISILVPNRLLVKIHRA
jgi:hypothetical protein